MIILSQDYYDDFYEEVVCGQPCGIMLECVGRVWFDKIYFGRYVHMNRYSTAIFRWLRSEYVFIGQT